MSAKISAQNGLSSRNIRKRWTPGCCIAILTVLFCVSGLFAADKLQVGSIAFTGNETFSRSELLRVMELAPPLFFFWKTEFTQRKLRSDVESIEDFYHSQGFIQARASAVADTVRRRVSIAINIDEGARAIVASVAVSPNPVVTEDAVARSGLRTGVPLVSELIDSVVRAFSDTLGAHGYLNGSIVSQIIIDTPLYQASVVLQVRAGPLIIVEKTDIKGLQEVRTDVVEHRLTFSAGDTLTSQNIKASQRRLYTTRLFNFVTIAPDLADTIEKPIPPDTAVPITVQLDEADYLIFDAGIGYGSYQRLYGSLLLSYGNLFHRGHTIATSESLSVVNQRAELIYTTPWLFMFPISVNTSVFYQRHDNWLFDVPLAYAGDFYGFTFGFGQPFGRGWAYRTQFEWENVLRLQVAPGGDIPEEVTTRSTASIIGHLSIDRRNDVFDPVSGYFARWRSEVAGLAGSESNQFVEFFLDVALYWRGGSRIRGGTGLSLGWARPYGRSEVIPPQDQFYAGGPQTVRGFAYDGLVTNEAGNPLGGNVLLVLHPVDLQFRLFWWLHGAVFTDAGYVWQDVRAVDLRDIEYAAGPGLRLASPLGLFRLDVGFQLRRLGLPDSYRAHFAYGRPF